MDGSTKLDISRRAVVLDTNIFVRAFSRKERDTEEGQLTRLGLNAPDAVDDTQQWIVPMAVLIEAWGMLHDSHSDSDPAIELLQWVTDPGNPIVVCRYACPAPDVAQIVNKFKVDVVDALLLMLANDLTEQCGFNPPVRVATSDTRDFARLKVQARGQFRLFDLVNLTDDE